MKSQNDKMTNLAEKYLIVKGCAGLGNRIYCLCAAIDYAQKTGRRLVVDWSDGLYFPEGYNFFSDYFVLKDVDYIVADKAFYVKINTPETSVFPVAFKNRLHLPLYSIYIQVTHSFIQKVAHRLFKKSKLMGYWVNKERYAGSNRPNAVNYILHAAKKDSFQLGANLPTSIAQDVLIFVDYTPIFNTAVFKQHFRFNNIILEKLVNEAKKHAVSDAIGVHVRATDMLPTKPVSVIINHLLQEHANEPVFLATDSAKMVELFKKNFSRLIIVEKALSESTVGVHQLAARNNDFSKAKEDLEHSLTDLYFLANSRKLYFQGNSSFSILAQAMRTHGADAVNWLKL